MKLNQFNVGLRVGALAGMLLLGTAVTGGLAWRALHVAGEQFEASHEAADQYEQAIDLARSAQVSFKIQVQEWKNLLLRGGHPESFEKYSKAFASEGEVVAAKLSKLKGIYGKLGQDSTDVDEAKAALATLTRKYTTALAGYDHANPDKAAHELDAAVKGMDRPPSQKIDDMVAKVLKASDANRTQTLAQALARTHATLLMMGGLMLLSLVFGVGASWVIMRSITLPLRQALNAATEVAQGNLTGRLHLDGKDEFSQLMTAMSRMSESLNTVVSQVRQSAEMVTHASAEIESGNADLSTRTENQASGLQETASAIEQLSSGVRHSADSAAQAQALAVQANQVAERGGTVVGQVVQTMNDINASSRRISEIIGVIDGIAFQTNILALNAAVEAARAGEQGRGFAVVASEVRALAQRSANAAKEIKTLINDSVTCVDRGATLVSEAGETITSTMNAVKHVRDMISEITASTSEQASGVGQVSQAISTMDNTMQQNAALVEQAAAAASSLRQQAQSLQDSVAFFQT
jgi:methyl-accepting chemotaxis protein